MDAGTSSGMYCGSVCWVPWRGGHHDKVVL